MPVGFGAKVIAKMMEWLVLYASPCMRHSLLPHVQNPDVFQHQHGFPHVMAWGCPV